MTTRIPLCVFCAHFRQTTDDEAAALARAPRRPLAVCAAFPFGVPREILYGTGSLMVPGSVTTPPADHTVPYPGDNGVTFEPASPAAAEKVREWFPNLAGVREGRI